MKKITLNIDDVNSLCKILKILENRMTEVQNEQYLLIAWMHQQMLLITISIDNFSFN